MRLWPIFIILFSLAALLHFSTYRIADPDALYHVRHAELLRTHGIFETKFPWVQFSSINTHNTDLWYGFHLLIIPFTLISDPLASLQLAGFTVTTGAIILYYLAFRYAGAAFPSIWTLMLFISSSQFLFRASMLRPHTLTSALTALMLPMYFFAPWWSLFAVGFFISFLHSTAFWAPLIIMGSAFSMQFFLRQKYNTANIAGGIGGVLLGIMLRPYTNGILPLLRVVLIDIQALKLQHVPLSIGSELKPFDLATILQQYVPIVLLLCCIFFFIKQNRIRIQTRDNVLLVSSGIISIVFLLLTIFVARRFIDLGNAFLFLTLALYLTKTVPHFFKKIHFILPVMIILAIYTGFLAYHEQYLYRTDPLAMQKPALWLRDNTQQGDIVFHAHWDDFPKLFFWNTHNYYINGMDPIMLYSFNTSLYYKQLYYAIDAATDYSCGANHCKQTETTPTRTILKDEFHSSYVMLDRKKNPKFAAYLAETAGYEQVYQDAMFSIFKLAP